MAEAGSKEVIKEYALYTLNASGIEARIRIVDRGGFVPAYEVSVPGLGEATKILLISLRGELLNLVPVDTAKVTDMEYLTELNKKYINAASVVIDKYLPGTKPEVKAILIAYIINIMLGLGDLEVLLADDNLEEVAVNSSKESVWVFHKKFAWCKTNIKLYNEEAIYDHA